MQEVLGGQVDFMFGPGIGLKGVDADTVFGFYAPAGLPAEILGTQAVKDRVAGLGGEVAPMTPAVFGTKAHEDAVDLRCSQSVERSIEFATIFNGENCPNEASVNASFYS